jgi:intein/homing endonuclease
MSYGTSQPIQIDTANSTTTPLGANATFTGTAVDCTANVINNVSICCMSDQAGTLQMQWSHDNVVWTDHIQTVATTANVDTFVSDAVRSRYYRIVLINGAVAQTMLRLQTFTSGVTTTGTVRNAQTPVSGTDEAQTTRAIITGQSMATNNYLSVGLDAYGDVPVVYGAAQADAFGRGRVATPTSLLSNHYQYDLNPLVTETILVGTGSVVKTTNASSATLSTGGTAASAGATIQAHGHYRYEPGKCVAASELITLASGERVLAADLVGKNFKLRTIVNGKIVTVDAFADWNMIEPVYEVITKSGKRIVRNGKHPLWETTKNYNKYQAGRRMSLTPPKWCAVANLSENSMVAVPEILTYDSIEADIPDEHISILAFMIGDGGMTKYATNFTNENPIIIDEFKSCANKLGCRVDKAERFRYNIYGPKKGNNKGQTRSGRNPLINLLRLHGLMGKGSYDKFVPSKIFEGTNRQIALFLSRLYSTDGWASGKGRHTEIGYCSTSRRLIYDIQELLLRFGIHGVVRYKHQTTSWNIEIRRRDNILTFAKEIGILGKSKAVESVVSSARNKKDTDGYRNLAGEGLLWEEIKSVNEIGIEATVAITVPKYCTYLTTFYEHNSQLITMSGVFGAYVQYVRKMIGYFDNNNGVFLDIDGTTAGANAAAASGYAAFTLRTNTSGSPVDTQTLQTAWNIDKMDGTGPSGIVMNFAKPQILVIDLQWLGTGRVRFGFIVNGITYYCHQLLYANVSSSTFPYMNTATLPPRRQIYNDPSHAAAGTTTMVSICASIISEGGSQSPQTLVFSADNGITTKTATTTLHPILSISPALTMNGTYNGAIYRILNGSILNLGSDDIRFALIYNGTLTGASFSAVNSSYSGMNFDTSATAISGGTVVTTGYISQASGTGSNTAAFLGNIVGLSNLEIPFTINAAGTVADVYSLCVQSLSSTTTVLGQLQWSEDR